MPRLLPNCPALTGAGPGKPSCDPDPALHCLANLTEVTSSTSSLQLEPAKLSAVFRELLKEHIRDIHPFLFYPARGRSYT